MDLDWLIFPSPDTSYTTEKYNGELIFIPKNQDFLNKHYSDNLNEINNLNGESKDNNASKNVI